MSSRSLELLDEIGEVGSTKNAYWRVAKQLDIPTKLAIIRAKLGNPFAVNLYGEVYGSGIQDLNYGLKGTIDFAAFDVMVEDGFGARRYLNIDEARSLVEGSGLRFVPELYRGPYDLEVIWELASGKEQVSGQELHLREGVVVKPVTERYDSTPGGVGRVVLKFVSDDYLLRKGNVTEFE
jgi:RNA ligase (TIGR02306 family)